MQPRLQARALQSDMASCKVVRAVCCDAALWRPPASATAPAANPGATLADFIRWHSPRDWVPFKQGDAEAGRHPEGALLVDWNGQPAGCLGPRMRGADNPWRVAWEQAQPCAACDQPPLFDATQEAERVLNYLETLTPGHLVMQVRRMSATAPGWTYTHLGVVNGSSLPLCCHLCCMCCIPLVQSSRLRPVLEPTSRNYKINVLAWLRRCDTSQLRVQAARFVINASLRMLFAVLGRSPKPQWAYR